MHTIWILNGPNLNLLGTRETQIYGSQTLKTREESWRAFGKDLGLTVSCKQTNSEGELVSMVQDARGQAQGLVINPGAYGHTSIALLDAVQGVSLPTIEVHISHIAQREDFRHQTFLSRAVAGTICGLGTFGYCLALQALAEILRKQEKEKE